MTPSVFDKDTLLDITVNIIPLAIMAFFIGAFLVFNPWDGGLTVDRILQFVLVGWVFVALAILTYLSAKAIETGDGDVH
jgi:hypothetical protein